VTPETEFVQTGDGVFVAYQVVGAGPVDVSADFHAFAGNVDLIWDEPDWGPLLASLAEFARLIIHDRRGSGASTRNVPPPNLETRAADLLAVLDAIGSDAPVLSRRVGELGIETRAGVLFEDRGEHELKGVPDRWHLYAAAGTAHT